MGDLNNFFSRSEFECFCGCGYDTVDALLLEALREIRIKFKEPVVVTSGCRCDAHNTAVGGSKGSQHKKGRAADIMVHNTPPQDVADYAEDLGLSVGRYSTFTHVDTRSGPPARWLGD
jgi:uncharacterized protein YcbK (DUF882 family)